MKSNWITFANGGGINLATVTDFHTEERKPAWMTHEEARSDGSLYTVIVVSFMGGTSRELTNYESAVFDKAIGLLAGDI